MEFNEAVFNDVMSDVLAFDNLMIVNGLRFLTETKHDIRVTIDTSYFSTDETTIMACDFAKGGFVEFLAVQGSIVFLEDDRIAITLCAADKTGMPTTLPIHAIMAVAAGVNQLHFPLSYTRRLMNIKGAVRDIEHHRARQERLKKTEMHLVK